MVEKVRVRIHVLKIGNHLFHYALRYIDGIPKRLVFKHKAGVETEWIVWKEYKKRMLEFHNIREK